MKLKRKYITNSKSLSLFIFGMSLLLFSFVVVSAEPFYPDCIYYDHPIFVMPGWNESFDPSNLQSYCLYEGNLFIKQRIFINRLGEPLTVCNADLYYPFEIMVTEQGNVKGVLVEFDYYFPNYMLGSTPVCMPNLVGVSNGLFKSPQLVMLANHQLGFPYGIDFNSALYQPNGEVTCDEWEHFSHIVGDFENDYGSSFSGRSKTIGTLGFEMKNVYIKNVQVSNSTSTYTIW